MRNIFFLFLCLLFIFDKANSQTYFNLNFTNTATINWTNPTIISNNNDWSNVPFIKGFRGDGLTTVFDIDPRTVLADGTNTPSFIVANQSSPQTYNGDGFAEFESLAIPAIAVKPSAVASAPFLVIYISTENQLSNFLPTIEFNLRDIDGSVNNAVQQVSIQYRVGETGPFIPANEYFNSIPQFDLFGGYHPDATQGPLLGGHRSVGGFAFPPSCFNQPKVQVRILFTNASGGNEWIAIEEIRLGGIVTLPIQYQSLSATSHATSVLLHWQANTTNTSDHFEIERSIDGRAFRKIGEQFAMGIGDMNYTFIDPAPVKGTAFYRLKLQEVTGGFMYTHVVSVKWQTKDSYISVVYPTIATSKLNLVVVSRSENTASIQIENISGAMVKKVSASLFPGSNNITIDIKDLAAGSYFIRLYKHGELFTERFIKL